MLPKLDTDIAEGLNQWPVNTPLVVQPTVRELADVIRSLTKGKAVVPDAVPVELFMIALNGDPTPQQGLLEIDAGIMRVDVPQQYEVPTCAPPVQNLFHGGYTSGLDALRRG